MILLRDRKGRDEDSTENQSLPKDMIHDMMLCRPGKSHLQIQVRVQDT